MTPKRDFFTAFRIKTSSESTLNPLLGSPNQVDNHTSAEDGAEEESTDFKLAILHSLCPDLASNLLLELLLSCDGSVEKASELAFSSQSVRKKPSNASALVGNQLSLATFFTSSSVDTSSNTLSVPKKIPYPLQAVPKGKTLHLTNPAVVPYYAPCTLHPSFLPANLAADLLRELVQEASTYGRQVFRLFDRTVSSPHSACFYVSDIEAALKQKKEYVYNGAFLDDIRPFTSTMSAIVSMVEEKVNKEIEKRAHEVYPGGKKLKHQMKLGEWKVNTAFVNCYDGGKESVGWHSDQLTYLGPRAVIASISLGVEREFRLRRVAARDLDEAATRTTDLSEAPLEDDTLSYIKADEKEKSSLSENEGATSIHLPHNSLLVMHAETQESFKHSVHPAAKLTPHPIAGNKRINITYRCYRESLHPKFTPRCKCGVPCVLRTVQRKEKNLGRYFWMCHAGNVPEGKNCTYFEWAEFDDDGEPIWKEKRETLDPLPIHK